MTVSSSFVTNSSIADAATLEEIELYVEKMLNTEDSNTP